MSERNDGFITGIRAPDMKSTSVCYTGRQSVGDCIHEDLRLISKYISFEINAG